MGHGVIDLGGLADWRGGLSKYVRNVLALALSEIHVISGILYLLHPEN